MVVVTKVMEVVVTRVRASVGVSETYRSMCKCSVLVVATWGV